MNARPVLDEAIGLLVERLTVLRPRLAWAETDHDLLDGLGALAAALDACGVSIGMARREIAIRNTQRKTHD